MNIAAAGWGECAWTAPDLPGRLIPEPARFAPRPAGGAARPFKLRRFLGLAAGAGLVVALNTVAAVAVTMTVVGVVARLA